MQTNSIERIATIEIKVKAEKGRYLSGPCHVSVSYLQLLGETDTALNHMNKYHALRKTIGTVAGQLGINDVEDNPDTHEFYFTLSSSTIRQIEAEVNKRRDELIASISSQNAPKEFINDLYGVRVITV